MFFTLQGLRGIGGLRVIACQVRDLGTRTMSYPASLAISMAVANFGILFPVTVPFSARRHSAVCVVQIFSSEI